MTATEENNNPVLTLKDVTDMNNALTVADEIEKRAIERSYLWMEKSDHHLREYFRNDSGFAVKLQKHTLGNPSVSFSVRDEQDNGDWMTVKIPAIFLFEDNVESRVHSEFERLSKKYGNGA